MKLAIINHLGPWVQQERDIIHSIVLSTQGRNGLGSIWVWASGNGGSNDDSCAADGYASNMYTIAVGSATSQGVQAYYDEACSGKMAVTYSHNPNGYTHVVRCV